MLDWLTADRGPSGYYVRHDPISARRLRLFACAAWRLYFGGDHSAAPMGARRQAEIAEAHADDPASPLGSERIWIYQGDAVACARNVANLATGDTRWKGSDVAALLREVVGNPCRPPALPVVHGGKLTSAGKTIPVMPMWWDHPAVFALARAAYDERGRACGRCKGKKKVWDDNPRLSIFDSYKMCCPACHGTGRTGDGTLDPARLSILSDALEEAGCAEEPLLRHLRGEEPCPECLGTLAIGDDSGGNVGRVRHCHCGTGWVPLRGPHVRGCWAADLLLDKS